MSHQSESGFPIASRSELGRAAGRLVRADPWMFVFTIGFGTVTAALALAPPWLAGVVIDEITGGASLAEVDRYGAVLVLLAVLQLLISRYSFLVTARFGLRLSQRLRRSIVDRVLNLPARIVDKADTGDLMVRTTGDTRRVTGIFSSAAPEMLVSIVQVVLTFVFVAVLSVPLAIVTIIGMLGIPLVTRWYLRRAAAGYLAEADGHGRLAESLSGTVNGARAVELYGLQRRRQDDIVRRAATARAAQFATLRLRSVLFPAVDSSYALALVLVLLAGAWMYQANAVALGSLIAILLYVRQMSGPLDVVLLWLESLQSAIASFARVEGLAGADVANPTPSTATPSGPRLAVADVSFAYEQGPTVLHGIDLEIRPGENLVIVGASGAGKSTLARLLVGIEAPTSGSITLGGVEVSALPLEVRRSHIALVTQEQHLFHDTIRTNLLLARPDAEDGELHAAMSAVGAHWLDGLPAGLDTIVSQHDSLSGAHAQQIALARVLLSDPQTVVLDEATSLLTPGSASTVERSLWSVLEDRTVITIAHRLATARVADRIAVIDGGRIRELGNHEELLRRRGLYMRLWNAWQGGPH
ncbi:ABC transporter ATP-binding protein [Glycomyces paridis]|nr:ABC transporter ATP-binding protein [Glycomyces paridis]